MATASAGDPGSRLVFCGLIVFLASPHTRVVANRFARTAAQPCSYCPELGQLSAHLNARGCVEGSAGRPA